MSFKSDVVIDHKFQVLVGGHNHNFITLRCKNLLISFWNLKINNKLGLGLFSIENKLQLTKLSLNWQKQFVFGRKNYINKFLY